MTAPGRLRLSPLAALLALGACAAVPTGPTVPVMPATGMSLDQFRDDDAVCQEHALAQLGVTGADQAASDSGARSTVAETAGASASDMQRRYDLGYIQCMYAKGHRVPVLGPMTTQPAPIPPPPPPPGTAPPAPPAAPR